MAYFNASPSVIFLASFFYLFACLLAEDGAQILTACRVSNSTDSSSSTWKSDEGFLSSPSQSLTLPDTSSSGLYPPFSCVRISQNPLSYSFSSITQPQCVVRLYFSSSWISTSGVSDFKFSVAIQNEIVIKDFSTLDRTGVITKEYYIHDAALGSLNVIFTPLEQGSRAFVSALEIWPVGSNVFERDNGQVPSFGDLGSLMDMSGSYTLESVFRVDVGDVVSGHVSNDSYGRLWQADAQYVLQSNGTNLISSPLSDFSFTESFNFAPTSVYATALQSSGVLNVTFHFDSSKTVLFFRLHFAEINETVSRINGRVFNILINDFVVQKDADIIAWASRPFVPYYADYALNSKVTDATVSLVPVNNENKLGAGVLINGVEVFQLLYLDSQAQF